MKDRMTLSMSLPLAKIYVDRRYRQHALPHRVARLVEHYNPALATPLVVNARKNAGGGVYSVIDGQHRFEAAKARGDTHIHCIVLAISYPEELREFREMRMPSS